VTFAEAKHLALHRAQLDLPFPVLADPDRQIYRSFGIGRGSLRQIWGPGTLKLYAKLLRRGRKLRRPTQDTRQLGGDFVIDRQGHLAKGFWPASPEDRPSVDALIDAVRRAR
jgi:peroxiredoxin